MCKKAAAGACLEQAGGSEHFLMLFYTNAIAQKSYRRSSCELPQMPNHLYGKRIRKCMCITESLCCTAEIVAALRINYTSIQLKKKLSRCQGEAQFSSYNFSVGDKTPCGPQNKHLHKRPKSTLPCSPCLLNLISPLLPG